MAFYKQGFSKLSKKYLLIILLFLNLFDYIITLVNRNNFEEANPIANLIIGNVWLLSILKLIIVPLCIYALYKYRYNVLSKMGTFVLNGVYLYAVVLGVLIYASG